MAVYITATTDPFEELRNTRTRPPLINVRRPLRGIQIKQDTYAVLRVLRANGEDLRIFDSSSPEYDENNIGRSSYYSNFIVQSFQEQRVEKQQIVQTFGEDYIFFFGEQPRFVNVSGVLINTKDFNWKNEFLENYEQYLRGTRLVEQNAKLYLYIDDVVIEGHLVNSQVQMMADNPYMAQFSFQMFVCQYAHLSTIGSVLFQENAEGTAEFNELIGDLAGGGVAPDTEEAQAQAASNAARVGSPGGLNGFLAQAGQFVQDASLSINRTLEVIRNTFYGRSIVVPQGIGNEIRPPLIENRASFSPAPVNQPISENWDEYPERTPPSDTPDFDQAELERVQSQMALQTPEELERTARARLEAAGIDTSRRETTYLLLGRGAFAAAQYMGTFGARQADGELNLAGVVGGEIL